MFIADLAAADAACSFLDMWPRKVACILDAALTSSTGQNSFQYTAPRTVFPSTRFKLIRYDVAPLTLVVQREFLLELLFRRLLGPLGLRFGRFCSLRRLLQTFPGAVSTEDRLYLRGRDCLLVLCVLLLVRCRCTVFRRF